MEGVHTHCGDSALVITYRDVHEHLGMLNRVGI